MISFPHRKMIPNQFLRNKVIFIHVPKCAGTSVSVNWMGYQIGHRNFRTYQKILKKTIDGYFIFSIVRNPISRFKSAYSFLAEGGISRADYQFYKKHRKLFLDTPNDFLRALKKGTTSHLHFRTMDSFLMDRDGDLSISYVHKIENELDLLDSALCNNVPEKLRKIIIHSLKKDNALNVGRDKQSIDFTNLDLDLLCEVYSADFWKFGYEKPNI